MLPDLLSHSEKTFVIVFDDGYECVRDQAFPVLERLGFSALLFMPTGCVGQWNDWDHQLLGRRFRHLDGSGLRELAAAGWQVGSHTVHHRSLVGLSDAKLAEELRASKRALENLLGHDLNWVAYPFGRYDRRVLDATLEAGYTGAVVPVRRISTPPHGLRLWEADAVYLWDAWSSLSRRLQRRGTAYRCGRGIRHLINAASSGTIIWRHVFPPRS